MKITYSNAGVDVRKIKKAHQGIGSLISATHSLRKGVISGYGHYAGLIEIADGKVLALHTDGVGTKVLVAQIAKRYNTIGIDCVAMNVNDIICVGAEPLAFVDYIALKKIDKELTDQITEGLVKGAKEAGIAIVGGETAVMPDVISGTNNAFDLAGTVVGVTSKDKLILGSKIKPGDVIVGLESNGLHSNGFSLVRKVLLKKFKIRQKLKELGTNLADELLRPTRIYVKPVMEIIKDVDVHGLAHVTGGAFTKLSRLNSNVSYRLDRMPEPPAVFKLVQKHAGITKKEMYSTFNMGIGFCVITNEADVDNVMKICKANKIKSSIIGEVSGGSGVFLNEIKL